MTQILLSIFLFALVFLATLWAVKKSAQWLKAERSGYGSAAIALAVTLLASILPQIILGQYLSPIILLVLSLAITAAIYAAILGTDFLRGLGITLISSILGLILIVVIFLGIGLLGVGGGLLGVGAMLPSGFDPFVDPEQQAADIKQAAERVCDCRSDRGCQQKRFAELTILIAQQGGDAGLGNGDYQMRRARACVNYYKQQSADPDAEPAPRFPPEQPSDSGDPAQGPGNTHKHIEGSFSYSQQADAPTQNPQHTVPRTTDDHVSQQRIRSPITIIHTPHKNRWSYHPIDMADAGVYLYETVRVTRRDNGQVIEGKLTPTKRQGTLALRQRRYSGIFIMEIPKAKIRKLELRVATTP